MANAYSYIRFSSKKQERGDSLRRQTERAAAWCEANGHTLDQSLTLRDMGVSAFRGKHRESGALGQFLEAIRNGQVVAGEILLVENLDRLSREGVMEALTLFADILRAGVKIAVLNPVERIYTRKSANDLVGLIEPLMHFYLAHEESQKRSDRVGAAWRQKVKRARENQTPTGKRRPSWLDWDEAKKKFTINHAATKAIRYIYERTADGCGQRHLTEELNAKFKPIGTAKTWNGSYVQKVLRDRAVLGEWQVCTKNDAGEREPVGEAITNYYPRIIDDKVWHRAQAAKARRRKVKGPNSSFVNLFVGLVVNARDGYKCHIQTGRVYNKNRDHYVQRRYISYGHLRRLPNACSMSVDSGQVETAVLSFLSEVKPSDMRAKKSRKDNTDVVVAMAELAGVHERLEALTAQLINPDTTLPTIINAVQRLEAQRASLTKTIEHLQQRQATDDKEPMAQARTIIEMLNNASADDLPALRKKLQDVLARVIESVYLLPYRLPNGKYIGATLQINLHNGTVRRVEIGRGNPKAEYAIGNRKALPNIAPFLDLRIPETVTALDKERSKMLAALSKQKLTKGRIFTA